MCMVSMESNLVVLGSFLLVLSLIVISSFHVLLKMKLVFPFFKAREKAAEALIINTDISVNGSREECYLIHILLPSVGR